MRILNSLSRTPFTLLCLLAPDPGAPAGGGSAPEVQSEAEECPAIEGSSFEEKVTSATGIVANLWGRLTKALGDLAEKTKNYTSLEGQFNSLKEAAQAEKDAHVATKGLLQTEKDNHTATSGKLTAAEKNVTRLETICGVKGLDKDQVVTPDAGKTQGSDKAQEYLSLKKQEGKGEVQRGTASKFYRENKKEIDAAK